MNLRVVVPSTAHIPRMTAHKIMLENNYDPWHLVIDNIAQKEAALTLGINSRNIVITDPIPSDLPMHDRIAWKRDWIERHIISPNEWYVSLDDDVSGWTELPSPWNQQLKIDLDDPPDLDDPSLTWRMMYAIKCPFETVQERWQELIRWCEERKTVYGGFAIENNFFFRTRKFQYQGYVRTGNAVIKNVGLPFYYWRGAMQEDFVRSVDVVARYGSVVINRFVKAESPAFAPGGLGTLEQRRPFLAACAAETMKRWPGLLRFNKGLDYQLTFALRSQYSIDMWRAEYWNAKAGEIA